MTQHSNTSGGSVPWKYCGVVTDIDGLALLGTAVDAEPKTIRVFAKDYPEPRLTRLYSTQAGHQFKYSSLVLDAAFWDTSPATEDPVSRTLNELAALAHKHAEGATTFDTALINLYRSGNDSVSAHSDKDGVQHIIASFSFGAERPFKIYRKHGNAVKIVETLSMENGSLLLMFPGMQGSFKHALPKHAKTGENARVNVTLRTQL